jgi:ribosomal-protein-alanine N-acetyltransferase
MKITLESERLKIVSLDATDTEQFFDFLMRNKEFFRKWSPAYEENYYSVWYHKAWLESIEREMKEGRQIKFGVYLKSNPNRIIGTVSFSNIIKGIFQSCFLGYRTDEHETNKGYISEAILRCVKYMFAEIMIHRIEANIMPANTASIRVMEKLGFENEGLAKKYLKVNGVWEDHFHYVLLNPEIE